MLCAITSDFYAKHCDSFSETRQAPWNGWKRCLGLAESLATEAGRGSGAPRGCKGEDAEVVGAGRTCAMDGPKLAGAADGARVSSGNAELRVFDLACGNMRFESYLASALPGISFSFYTVDNCKGLLPEGVADGAVAGGQSARAIAGRLGSHASVEHQNLDVAGCLVGGEDLGDRLHVPICDLSVSFGFMHHIPLPENRERVLSALIERTRSGGFVVVSFWQFMNNEAMAAKAREVHAVALEELGMPELDAGDFLLGWKNTPGAYRYCHSFSRAEIDGLIAGVADKIEVAARFSADGRTDDLNAYVVLRVR